jgi:hypothetical protein
MTIKVPSLKPVTEAAKNETVRITPPNFKNIELTIRGTAPYMQNRFGEGAIAKLRAGMEAGSQTAKSKKKPPRDFDQNYAEAFHVSSDGWVGVPAVAFRKAAIDVCRMVNFKMTHAKQAIFIAADGYDKVDGMPLVRLIAGEAERTEMIGRVANGQPDIRVRPMWRKWAIKLRVKYDEDQFSATDIVNLIARAGEQVGIGEGRPFSKDSVGMGFGTFEIA